MSEIKDFDLSKYLEDEEIHIEDVNLANCRMVSSENLALVFCKSVFQNVIFDGNNEKWGDVAVFEDCEFRNCIFRGDFGAAYLDWRDNLFKNCLFENINIEYGGDISSIVDNGFLNCNFRNVNLNQDIHLLQLTISGGEMQNMSLFSTNMISNVISNVQMNHVKISALYGDNIMDSITFRDVFLEWESPYDPHPDNNIFYQCDTSGLICRKHVGGEY